MAVHEADIFIGSASSAERLAPIRRHRCQRRDRKPALKISAEVGSIHDMLVVDVDPACGSERKKWTDGSNARARRALHEVASAPTLASRKTTHRSGRRHTPADSRPPARYAAFIAPAVRLRD
ncbi:hypothetical protein [Burkholderia thailandensis]|uniref:hypothetical protein n=1 Tax=Burkholderia thailandensis TaxID=57975 RepID=UPI00298FE6BB|nr:hypothetical protein [Burkholderia thailandensis]